MHHTQKPLTSHLSKTTLKIDLFVECSGEDKKFTDYGRHLTSQKLTNNYFLSQTYIFCNFLAIFDIFYDSKKKK